MKLSKKTHFILMLLNVVSLVAWLAMRDAKAESMLERGGEIQCAQAFAGLSVKTPKRAEWAGVDNGRNWACWRVGR